MTSSFVPPTQPSPTSNHHQLPQDPLEPFPAPRSTTPAPRTLPRTIVLEPPPFSEAGIQHPIIFVSISDRLVAISSKSVLSVFQLRLGHSVSSPDEPPSVILAQWPCPQDHCIAAMTLSPDASAIALVVHRPRNSAALVLLHAITCDRLLRIALPSTFAYGSTVSSSQSPISFITARTSSVATSPPPDDVLPSRLRRLLGIIDASHSGSNTGPSAPMPVHPLAQWALVVSSSALTSHVLLISFCAGYRRVHHLSYLALPVTSVPCVIHPAPILFGSSTTSLILLLPRLAFRLVNTSFDQVVANCDVPMQSLLGIAQSGVVVSLCKRANGALAIAVIDEPTLTITSMPFRASDVRAAALLTSPDGDDFVAIVPSDGFPRVVANLSLMSPGFVTDVPHVRLRQDRIQNGVEDWCCAADTPADVSMIGSTIVAAYADERRVVVRFTEYEAYYRI